MADHRRLLRSGASLAAVLALSVGTFLVLDLLGLRGWDRFLGYVVLTTVIAGGLLFYVASTVVEHQKRDLDDR